MTPAWHRRRKSTAGLALKSRDSSRPPLYGLYDVEKFTQNGTERPPLLTDAKRWKKFASQFPTAIQVRSMDDNPMNFGAAYDTATSTLTLNKKDNLVYSFPDSDHVQLAGSLNNEP